MLSRTPSWHPLFRHRWIHGILGCCWFLVLGTGSMDASSPGSYFEYLGPEVGLPHHSVYDVAVDPQGFLWLATQNGLARFDGYDLRVFRHAPEDPHSLPNNYTKALALDDDGVLWIGTNGGSLSRFDPRQETFETFREQKNGEPRVTRINEVVVASHDHLWLVGGEKVRLFRPSLASFQSTNLSLSDADSVEGAGIFASRSGQQGSAWYITSRKLLRLEPDQPEAILVKEFPDDFRAIAAFTEDPERLWLASERELISWHYETGQWTSQTQLLPSLEEFLYLDIRPMMRDAEGHFWLGLVGVGLFRLTPDTDTASSWTQIAPDESGLHHILAMAEDHSGILWFATYADGLAKLDPTRQGATLLRHRASDPQSLGKFGVRAVAASPSGRIWVGHFGSGIDALDSQGQVRFRLSTAEPHQRRISHDAVWALHEDDAGRLWIGHEMGLDRYDPRQDVVERIQMAEGPLDERITTFTESDSGYLYVGGSQGLYVVHIDQDVVAPVLPVAPPLRSPSEDLALHAPIHALYVDSQNHLWIGTDGAGLFRLDLTSSQLRHFPSRLHGPSQVQLGIVSAFHQDARGVVWMTTLGGGLLRFDAEQDEVVSAPTNRPLLSTFVSALLPAPDGTFWLPTHNGLNRYDPATGHVDTWDASDGLPARGFTTKASTLAPQGTLFLGSRDGLYILQPDSFGVHSTAPRPVLTQLNLFNRPVVPQRLDAASPLRQTLTWTESLTLRYNQNPFSIEFSALHFANPSKNRYEYRLWDVDPRWIQASSDQRVAVYSHVPPGRYLFEVKATSRDGVSSEETAQLEIRILPPPWRTWWAHSVYAIALLSAIFAFVRAQRHKVMREREINRQLDELVKLRTEQVNVLNGLLPICSCCKKIRDDEGYWSEVESYVEARSEAVFSHSLCPPCAHTLYPDLDLPGKS